MIIGFVRIENGAVNTHRDSYLLENLSVVSVRRPFLIVTLIFASGVLAFILGFYDLLYLVELVVLLISAALLLIAGQAIGQLKLISRETKGTELAGAVWGNTRALQDIRRSIVKEMGERSKEELRA